MFGVIPERFRPASGKPGLDTLFAMARGVSKSCCGGGAQAQEMTKWFDTNYHYLVPEFSVDQQFELSWSQLFEEVEEAKALGHTIKPVLIGPLSYLWLGKLKGEADQTQAFDKLELLDRLLPVYGEVLDRLAAAHGERFAPTKQLREMAASGATFYRPAPSRAAA